jgi:hypothetical protein
MRDVNQFALENAFYADFIDRSHAKLEGASAMKVELPLFVEVDDTFIEMRSFLQRLTESTLEVSNGVELPKGSTSSPTRRSLSQ